MNEEEILDEALTLISQFEEVLSKNSTMRIVSVFTAILAIFTEIARNLEVCGVDCQSLLDVAHRLSERLHKQHHSINLN